MNQRLSRAWRADYCTLVEQLYAFARYAELKKEGGVAFGITLTVLAVVLTIGAVWFALAR
jgi:hypothetical protein